MSYAKKVDPKFDELKNIKNRTGVGKRKRECEDLLLTYTLMDARKMEILNFVASNALRLPRFKIEDVGALQIAVNINDLTAQVNELKSSLNEMNVKVCTLTIDISACHQSSTVSAIAAALVSGSSAL